MGGREGDETVSGPALAYLPSLDGLRAIAVATVLAYHLDIGLQRGGFLGVDLFFVISGYLITTLLLREHDARGGISLGGFWTRRFRRLLPPLVIVLAATITATRLWGVPEQWSAIRGDALATIGYVANWRFIVDEQSYFELLLAPSPLRHMWSLAVEEQWYLVWPLAVVALLRLGGRHRALGVIAAAAVASAVAMAVSYRADDPSFGYYATHTRAQQLLVGALLAWALVAGRLSPVTSTRRRDRALGAFCLAGFATATVVVDHGDAWLYRGGLLAISILCAGLVWSVAAPDGGAVAWLGAAPIRWLGVRSYSLYLWHWPVIVFVGAPMGLDATGAALALTRIAVSLALADLTYRFVEVPLRGLARAPRRRQAVVGWSWAAGTVGVALLAVLVLRPPPSAVLAVPEIVTPQRGTARVVAAADRSGDPVSANGAYAATEADATDEMAGAGDAAGPVVPPATNAPTGAADRPTSATLVGSNEPAASPEPTGPRTALIFGDSRAIMISERASTFAAPSPNWRFEGHARFGCAIVPGESLDEGRSEATAHNRDCVDWTNEWASSHALVQPDVSVVMIGAWEMLDHRIDGQEIRYPSAEWRGLVADTYRRAIDVADGPDDRTPVVLLALPCMSSPDHDRFPTTARNDADRTAAYNQVVRAVAAEHPDRIHVLDHTDLFCADGEPAPHDDDMRYDGVHVTARGADAFVDWLVQGLDGLSLHRPTAEPTAIAAPQAVTRVGVS